MCQPLTIKKQSACSRKQAKLWQSCDRLGTQCDLFVYIQDQSASLLFQVFLKRLMASYYCYRMKQLIMALITLFQYSSSQYSDSQLYGYLFSQLSILFCIKEFVLKRYTSDYLNFDSSVSIQGKNYERLFIRSPQGLRALIRLRHSYWDPFELYLRHSLTLITLYRILQIYSMSLVIEASSLNYFQNLRAVSNMVVLFVLFTFFLSWKTRFLFTFYWSILTFIDFSCSLI